MLFFYWTLINVALSFVVGQELKSRILVSLMAVCHKRFGIFFPLFLKTATLICWIGGKSCWRLCSPVHELHECYLCCPEAGKLIQSVLFVTCISSKNITFVCILKQNILIDACILDSDSGLLQQVHFSGFVSTTWCKVLSIKYHIGTPVYLFCIL